MTGRRIFHGLVYDSTAALAAASWVPFLHHVLRIGGNQYGGAWALIAVAWFWYWRTGWWLAWTTLLATVVATVTDLPVVHDTVTYLTGAIW